MPLIYNKKADIGWWTFIEVILILVGVIILIAIIIQASSRAEEGTSEKLCRASNAIRYGTEVDKGPVSFNVVPRACKTLDKGDLPGQKYKDHVGGLKEGAKAELADMMAKCWYMWLEGKQPDMFKTGTTSLQNKCFICYAFSLDKNVDSIKPSEIFESLEKPYYAVDRSDKCAGTGGFCKALCGPAETEVVSLSTIKKCPIGAKCCISKFISNECENRGGICSSNPLQGRLMYDKWKCSSGNCYVKAESMVSYLDYIQGTRGAEGGAGFLLFEDNALKEGLQSRQKYAVTLISPGRDPGIDTALLGLGTGATLALGTYATAKIGLSKPQFLLDLTTATVIATAAMWQLTQKSGTLPGYNFIYLSDYSKVQDKCAIEFGVDAR